MVALLRMTGRAGCPGASLPRAPCLSLLLLKHLSWDRLAGSVRVRGAGYSHSSYSSRLLDPPVQGQASPPRQCRSKCPPSKGESGSRECRLHPEKAPSASTSQFLARQPSLWAHSDNVCGTNRKVSILATSTNPSKSQIQEDRNQS